MIKIGLDQDYIQDRLRIGSYYNKSKHLCNFYFRPQDQVRVGLEVYLRQDQDRFRLGVYLGQDQDRFRLGVYLGQDQDRFRLVVYIGQDQDRFRLGVYIYGQDQERFRLGVYISKRIGLEGKRRRFQDDQRSKAFEYTG